ncbi:pali-domain-containing protein, partial [Piedraia hortae CBS 480.64]
MGLLRPATPLALIFLAAFVCLLLSTLSAPIIHSIPLGSYQGYNFGVLGYCNGNDCHGPQLGYSTDGLFKGGDGAANFNLPSSARQTLSSILIIHPIAALMVLICLGLALAAHFHGPSNSPRYLLALLILTIPTLLVTLLAFLVDVLLFQPHTRWGGWIVLAATILIILSTIVTCVMRRTLVSRKARKKRIAENADMNGSNYFNQRNQQRLMTDELPRADSPPPTAPKFATFDASPARDPTSMDGVDAMSTGAPSVDDPPRGGVRGGPVQMRGRGGYGPPRGGMPRPGPSGFSGPM